MDFSLNTPNILDELCRCGHLKSHHQSAVHHLPSGPQLGQPGHGPCIMTKGTVLCACEQFSWTDRFKVGPLDPRSDILGILAQDFQQRYPKFGLQAGRNITSSQLLLEPRPDLPAFTLHITDREVTLYTYTEEAIHQTGWLLSDPDWLPRCHHILDRYHEDL